MENTSTNCEIITDIIDELGVIAEDTQIVGQVTTKGHLAVAGTIDGDITAKGNVLITGTVKGKIQCSNLSIKSGKVNSEIVSDGTVEIREKVQAIGNIQCKDIAIKGSIVGNITAAGNVVLFKTASVSGNIKAASIGMEMGAKINGNITMA